MKIKQITETTTAGSIATVNSPLGVTQSRGNPSIYGGKKVGNLLKGKKTSAPYANSVNESAELSEAHLEEDDIIVVPGQGRKSKTGFIPHGQSRLDHEVEMARSDLFSAAKNAQQVYLMIKDVGEDEGLDGWVQEKIIKANDYLNTIREYLEGKQVQGVTENNQRGDSLVTDALKIMRGSDYQMDPVRAIKTVLGEREYNSRRGFYNFYVKQLRDMYDQGGLAEGWQEESQDLEDWSKEVNKKLYRAHENQRRSLAIQLSKLEQKHFGSELTNGPLTNIVFSTLQALNKGQMVHYDPQSVGQMPFGSIVGDEARMIAASGMKKYDIDGYRGLRRAGIVDNFQQFLHLRDLADNQGQAILKYTNMPPVAAWMQFIKDIGWSKDDMNEEVQAKTDDKLLAYYAQRKAEKQKQQGASRGGQVYGQPEWKKPKVPSPTFTPGKPLPQSLQQKLDNKKQQQGVAEGKRNLKCVCKTHGTMQCPVHTPKDIEVIEGAKVDRMVKHVAQSEKKLGHSKKEAENIAWATANKRGMLNNKNKKA